MDFKGQTFVLRDWAQKVQLDFYTGAKAEYPEKFDPETGFEYDNEP